jgi:transmembrane 9 superfamily protein 2/4
MAPASCAWGHAGRLRLVLAIVSLTSSLCYYLPGMSPMEYKEGAPVELKVNKLTSVKTQLPYSYYTLPYCRPNKIIESAENLGEIMTGDRIENSPFDIRMLEEASCKELCKVSLKSEDKQKFKRMIDEEYLVNWMVDNLPAATRFAKADGAGGDFIYMDGFPVGVEQNGKYFIHNHVKLDVKYHKQPDEFEAYRVVGFEVEPHSMTSGGCQDKSGYKSFELSAHDEIVFTYDVQWTESPIRWSSRWDAYLKMAGGQIHWFAIINSLVIVLFLSGMVAMILLRTLHRDIAKYNELATAEEQAEETGWKLVHADVFRKPVHSSMLAVSVASGMQILGMAFVVLFLALLGILSPAHRGALLQSMMFLFTLMGTLAGYTAARFCKIFDEDEWKKTTLLTALFYPGIFFGIFFVLNLFIWGQKSSGAVPFTTMFALLMLWFGISVPLVYLGSFKGFKKDAIELPVRTSQLPRQIPEQPWYTHGIFMSLVGGLLPFGAVFTELFFIMSSMWQHQYYYLFGFLALVLIILIVTCAEISIALTYFQLTSEDYRWWWRSFFASASSAIYVFLYSILYFSSRLQMDRFVSIMLYFGYMLIISVMFFLVTGSIGLLSTFFFVRAIYGSIKID